ncbi:DUF922 domain-containing protein [Rhizobium sp. BK251]|uniref:DUF922 domain-containing Zn-dependent protease n=1 Tax=Rhizobium sp. BK251 TaxID=2512125 RepID=UPI001049D745|nr:DUF922 domain-containing protein [Rhizobium sp. BK251]TCL73935.1 putative secreted Zn-dependent protease [Rhizobium sp. BK251]
MRHLLPLALLALPTLAHAADWQPVEQTKTYPVTGTTGIELYRSIGERGPAAGTGRAIAHTTFKLTWTRDYRPQPDGACVLAVARPKLVITYTLPKAPTNLPPATRAKWQNFVAGIERHERVHGAHVIDMVKEIEAFSLGLSAPADPKCQKVRAVLQARLGEISNAKVRRDAEFERSEMGAGGNVQQLVLALVNGS